MMSSTKQIFGIVGDPVSHSLSPVMHEAAFREMGIDGVYERFGVPSEELPGLISLLKEYNVSGVNVTIPHKESIIPFLDRLDPFAQQIGAVNTIIFENGQTIGFNTDASGFMLSVADTLDIDWTFEKVVVLGAGGSGQAIAHMISQENPMSLTVVNRSVEKSIQLAEKLSETSGMFVTSIGFEDPRLPYCIQNATVLINTTPLGMGSMMDQTPLPKEWLRPRHTVIDIVYSPRETVLLKDAMSVGARVMNGLGMLAGQGALAFELFTGSVVSSKYMMEQLNDHISNEHGR